MAAPSAPHVRPYYPHWVTRDGNVTAGIMSRLPAGTIIGAHHAWDLATLRRILDHPGKHFQISWYVESNVGERDDPTAVGVSVAARIAEAVAKQQSLLRHYGSGRFAGLFELNGSRDKKDGNLVGRGNRPADWLRDAAAVQARGFRLIAKSPAPDHVDELRARFGKAFVPRIVFEDVSAAPGAANAGYRRDAKILSGRGETVTLVIHSGAYGGFPATPLPRARSVIASDFMAPATEAFWGRATAAGGFERVKSFAATTFATGSAATGAGSAER
ncbi:MAG: hypothetical protein AB7O57_10510 [Hyphomicrobiaceae bacterium]